MVHIVAAAFIVLVGPVMASAVEPGSVAYLDHKNGFRVEFGTAKDALINELETPAPSPMGEDARGVKTDVRLSECVSRRGDKLSIGKVQLLELVYCFGRDGLYSVNLSAANGLQLWDALRSVWGERYASSKKGQTAGGGRYLAIEWHGDRASARLETYYIENGDSTQLLFGSAEIWSNDLYRKKKQRDEERERTRLSDHGKSIEGDF